MKRLFFSFAAVICVLACGAQVRLAIFAGPHLSSAYYSVKSSSQPTQSKPGFQLGTAVKIPFENKLSFTPALSYKLMGYKVVFNSPSFPPDRLATNNNTTLHELDLDLALQFDLGESPGHFFVKAGPSFAVIMAGHESYDLLTGGHVDRTMKFSVLNSYGRYGAAAVVQFGYEMRSGFFTYINYVYHFVSMNNQDNGPSIHNYLLGISFGKFIK